MPQPNNSNSLQSHQPVPQSMGYPSARFQNPPVPSNNPYQQNSTQAQNNPGNVYTTNPGNTQNPQLGYFQGANQQPHFPLRSNYRLPKSGYQSPSVNHGNANSGYPRATLATSQGMSYNLGGSDVYHARHGSLQLQQQQQQQQKQQHQHQQQQQQQQQQQHKYNQQQYHNQIQQQNHPLQQPQQQQIQYQNQTHQLSPYQNQTQQHQHFHNQNQ